MSKLENIQKKLETSFNDIGLLEEAITHRSYLNENEKWQHRNNERLEFLGDAVLELVVTEELFDMFPEKEEGELTIYRAALVNTKILSIVAYDIKLDEEVLLSRGEARDFSGRGKESISANVVEAIIGAIYLDQGYDVVKKFIVRNIISRLDSVIKNGGKDPKSLVQEIAQSDYKITPTYRVIGESGPAHDRHFNVGLYFNHELKAEGGGKSKQEAETEAAQKLLDKLGK